MTLLTGRGGRVNGVTGLGDWEIQKTTNAQTMRHAGTGGGTHRVDGMLDWSGSYNAQGAVPTVLPGNALTGVFSVDGSDGYSGTAIVDQVQISWDFETNKPVVHAVNFSGNGELSSGAAVASESEIPAPTMSSDGKVSTGTVAAEPEWTDMSYVRTAQLTLSSDNKEVGHTGTSGLKNREAGPFDASLSLTVYSATGIDLPDEGDVVGVRIYNAAATYWEILWMHLGEISGIKVSPETEDIVGATLNYAWANIQSVGGTMTLGSITDPDETDVFSA